MDFRDSGNIDGNRCKLLLQDLTLLLALGCLGGNHRKELQQVAAPFELLAVEHST